MKRRLVLLLLLLMGGAIVNVAVAWGCTIGFPSRAREIEESEAESTLAQWSSIDRSGYEFTNVQGSRTVAFGWQMTVVNLMLIDTDVELGSARNDSVMLFAQTAGWPTMCLTCAFASRQDVGGGGLGIPKPLNWYPNDLRLLPTRPIWPRFAINTVFYAVVVWLLFAAPFALRRRRRIKRGLCPKCAYDLRGTPSDATACPECGEAVPSLHFGQR